MHRLSSPASYLALGLAHARLTSLLARLVSSASFGQYYFVSGFVHQEPNSSLPILVFLNDNLQGLLALGVATLSSRVLLASPSHW